MMQEERPERRKAVMNIVKASKLIYDYIRRDEEENIEEVDRAIDSLDVEIEKGSFVGGFPFSYARAPHIEA